MKESTQADPAALGLAVRCDGRYPVPSTSPPRDEPFEVTYRCGRRQGHSGPHGPSDDPTLGLAVTPAQRAWLVQYFIAGELCEECFTERWRAEAFVNESSPNQRAKLIPLIAEQDHATLLARVAELEQQVRIEPLHAPTCPFKPYEDSYDTPDDVACTCGDLSARWKARAVVERMQRREAEARVAALTAERDKLAMAIYPMHGREWSTDALASLAAAQRQDSEDIDEVTGGEEYPTGGAAKVAGALRQQVNEQAAIQTALVAALAPEKLQRLGNLIANLAHPKGDHKQNDLEDEAHDLLREIREAALARVAAGKKA